MKKLLFIMMITSLTTLSGCETFDPYTGEEKTSNTAKGAGIGAGVGAVLAYIANRDESSKKRKKRITGRMTPKEIALGDMYAREYRDGKKK